jgi:hypothetical protein
MVEAFGAPALCHAMRGTSALGFYVLYCGVDCGGRGHPYWETKCRERRYEYQLSHINLLNLRKFRAKEKRTCWLKVPRLNAAMAFFSKKPGGFERSLKDQLFLKFKMLRHPSARQSGPPRPLGPLSVNIGDAFL